MKKTITIVIIALVVLGFGYFLFKISPQQQVVSNQDNFDLSQAKPQTEPNPISADDNILGNPNAKNTLIAYEDFQCPACAAIDDTLNQVPSQLQDTKLVFRYFPLTRIHKNSVISEYAAEAAGAQGKFWEMHDLLFKQQNDWAELDNPLDVFVTLAQKAGVSNIGQFKTDITSGKFKNRIQENLAEATGLNLPGTPTLYFNGKVISAGTMEQIKTQAEKFYK